MKHFIKRAEPQSFSAWKAQQNDDWIPTYSDLGGVEKRDVKSALMVEQGYICCYCERGLKEHDSHIEHFQPQSDPDVDPLDFSNMICSCQKSTSKGEPRHCGTLKAEWFDSTLLISPLNPRCEDRFSYLVDGEIQPAISNDIGAQTTIAKLGLDIPKLKALRAKTIDPFLDENLTHEDVRQFVNAYLEQDEQGKFQDFWTTIRYLFRGYVT